MRIAMLCAALVASASAAAQQPPRPPSISVTGSGEAELKPDFARIFVTVGTQADTIAQAVDLNRAATERALGWQPAMSFDEGLARTVDWYLANRAWWQEIQRTGRYDGGRLGQARPPLDRVAEPVS